MAKQKVGYIDGFVIVSPRKKIDDYRKMAKEGLRLWMKHGALSYKECMIDDAKPAWTKLTFPKMAKIKANEVVWFSYIEYKNRKHRDAVNAKVMKDPLMSEEAMKDKPMPFDMNKFAYGGFEVMVSD